MEAVQVTTEERQVLDAMRASPKLKGAIVALVEVAQNGELSAKSAGALAKASEALPEPKIAPKITIEQMKAELRTADCLYDNEQIWNQLGAETVPTIPEAVIQEAYEKGGRVILRCSSISEKADALEEAIHSVVFWGSARQSHYQESVSKPEWIVVPSHIDRSTLGSPKSNVVTSEMPAPTPEDWFSVSAYARLDGGRQPKGCEGLYAFTTETGTVVGSFVGSFCVFRHAYFDRFGDSNIGAARFGPPRN
jgi:hypothetical protein